MMENVALITGASALSVAECGYEAMLKGELLKINERSLNFAHGRPHMHIDQVHGSIPQNAVLMENRRHHDI